MLAARWGVAPDPHQGRCPWTPLRALALRTHSTQLTETPIAGIPTMLCAAEQT